MNEIQYYENKLEEQKKMAFNTEIECRLSKLEKLEQQKKEQQDIFIKTAWVMSAILTIFTISIIVIAL